ncbi:hypothetical protein X805_35770 [Sphaerotilus natans subsp. natans DSM 6575]|uniref:Uncharacterized protein n=1 Tax=Sphaerotilus natans subsp. natans DSM 6575 TaxID=1286631 RepID=A0A059KI89_9BURK|nr:hypothetical protein X805_35770 [Sphaerotilus natans subsp. natans DSM 6575]
MAVAVAVSGFGIHAVTLAKARAHDEHGLNMGCGLRGSPPARG